jgi:hypothetical protein
VQPPLLVTDVKEFVITCVLPNLLGHMLKVVLYVVEVFKMESG